ncbi:MAG TPA: hypothetical protein VE685_21300 [Thermoanaerobaculia bacterium]|nr:hypothetical protein [Thermoanaerobaculia bacterium]
MTRRTIVLALLFVCGRLAAQQPQTTPETFSEEVFVRELELVVDPSDALERKALRPGDFQVLVDGEPREVTRVETVAESAAPWTVVVYVDQILAGPQTVFSSTLALAKRAEALTRMGTVEVVTSGSDPGTVLSASRDARLVRQVLAGIAEDARVARDRAAKTAAGRRPEPPPVGRQLDKLVTHLAGRSSSGPRLLFLVTDGVRIPPDQRRFLDSPAPSPDVPAAAVARCSRLLAAYGWVVIPLAFREEETIGRRHSMVSDVDRIRETTSGSGGAPPVILVPQGGDTPLAWDGVLELLVNPQIEALQALARPTTGTVVGYESQLDLMLDELSRRRRLWIAAPPSVDGRVQAVEVKVPNRVGEVRAQAWVRSSTPEGVAEARLRNLLAGEPAGGPLPLRLSTREVAPSVLEVRFEVAPRQAAGPAPPGPVRISYAFLGAGATPEIRHEVVAAENVAARGWSHTARVSLPPGTRRVAVVVEDLSREVWRGTFLPSES